MDNLIRILTPRSRIALPLLALSIVTVGLSVWLAILGFRAHGDKAAMTAHAAQLRAISVEKPKVEPTKAELEETKQWGLLQKERNFTWAPLFSAVEKASSQDIELLEFQPEKANRSLLLRGEARDDAALLEFVDALADQPVLSHVHITHRKIRHRDRLITIIFEIKANIPERVL